MTEDPATYSAVPRDQQAEVGAGLGRTGVHRFDNMDTNAKKTRQAGGRDGSKFRITGEDVEGKGVVTASELDLGTHAFVSAGEISRRIDPHGQRNFRAEKRFKSGHVIGQLRQRQTEVELIFAGQPRHKERKYGKQNVGRV